MLEIVRCCRCNEAVRLPESMNAIWVRCPLCGADYPLDQVTTQMPPALEAIPQPSLYASPDSNAPTAKSGELLVPPIDPKVVLEEKAPTHRVPSPSQLHAERKKMPPTRKKSGSAGASFAKVALGGIAGLFIGQLILWWLPADVRSDPLELAPRLPSAVAFLAPESFRDPSSRHFDEGPTISDADFEANTNTELRDTTTTPIPPVTSTETSDVVVGLADAPKIRMPELRNRLREAETANANLVKEKAWTSESVGTWYRSLSELAYCVTFGDMSEPNITKFAMDTKNFLRVIASDSGKIEAIGKTAAATINSAANHRKGVLVTGQVNRIVPAGDLFQTDLTLAGEPGTKVSVISRIDPREARTYTLDDHVLILGVVITDPSLYLLGYQGTAEPAVLGGMPIKIN